MLTTAHAAKFLGCHVRTIRYLIERGHLTAQWHGGRWFIDDTALVRLQRPPRGWPKGKKRKET